MSLVPTGFGSSGDVTYTIGDSLRFRSSASAYLSRTPGGAGDRRTWTWSGWVKLGTLSSYMQLFDTSASSTDQCRVSITSANAIQVDDYTGSFEMRLTTSALLRDPSAWYHIVIVMDTTQATEANRVSLYINGVKQTSFSNEIYPSQNYDTNFNNTVQHNIGRRVYNNDFFFDGYLTETNFIDGQALDAEDFGELDDNGTWKPIEYEGTYGTNGFYLDGTGVTDESGNGNDWTNNNLNLATSTATTYDLMKDTPSLVDENAGNFATLNPLKNYNNTLADGNLNISASSAVTTTVVLATIGVSSGKWYWEYVQTSTTGANLCLSGLARDNVTLTVTHSYIGMDANGWGYYGNGWTYHNAVANSSYGATYGNNDVIGVAFDADAGTLVFYKNGVSQGTAYTGLTSGPYFPAFGDGGSTTNIAQIANFGQRPFAYTPPSGFLKLNTFNLPDSTIEKGSDYFNTVLYTGTGTSGGDTQALTGLDFQPDFIWIKNRTVAVNHYLNDVIRGTGAGTHLHSNGTNSESSASVYATNGGLASIQSDGLTVYRGTDNTYQGTNKSSNAYAAWNWKANGSGVLNEVGDIDSTVSANTTSGFSIVSFTGTGAATTVGHGLGVAPKFMVIKSRTTVEPWLTYHGSLGGTQYLFLNQTGKAYSHIAYFNNTDPTSTVFSLGNSAAGNTNTANYIAYCFAPVEGYSAFGKYTGNGSADGPFIYTGFRPAWVLVKSTTGAVQHWWMFDNKREGYNVKNGQLYANLSSAEGTSTILDIVSTGFKMRTSSAVTNGNAVSYIYMAFAENPFKNSNAR